MSFYICKKTQYGKNNNLTRWEVIGTYHEHQKSTSRYKKWCFILVVCLLVSSALSFYFEYRVEGCMTEGKIQQYFQEQLK